MIDYNILSMSIVFVLLTIVGIYFINESNKWNIKEDKRYWIMPGSVCVLMGTTFATLFFMIGISR